MEELDRQLNSLAVLHDGIVIMIYIWLKDREKESSDTLAE